MGKTIISPTLPKEKIENLRFLYIVIDSDLKIHYELHNKGHVILPIRATEILPWMAYKYLPQNLIRKCVSSKKNIVGVLQLWIYYTKDYAFARLKALGILSTFTGNRVKALFSLLRAMDAFGERQDIVFVETETHLPAGILQRSGFIRAPPQHWWRRIEHFLIRQKHYVKYYPRGKRLLKAA